MKRLLSSLLALLPLIQHATGAEPNPVQFSVEIKPLPAEFAKLESAIREHTITAARMWVDHCICKPCTIEIEFRVQPWPARGFGRSLAGARLPPDGKSALPISEEGWAHEIRTGQDAIGASPGVELGFDPAYFRTLWWESNPKSRHRPMPNDKLDAMSVILHELGHAFGFNGHLDVKTGAAKDGVLSPYDRWVTFDGSDFFFIGPAATKLYRKPVPLAKTANNYHHVGEQGPRLDRMLKEDLMNGVVMEFGRRYSIIDLDLAILSDCGLPVKK